MKQGLVAYIAKTRWLKKLLIEFIPEVGAFKLNTGHTIYYDTSDFRGPSFYLVYGGGEAFHHYEQDNKKQLLSYLKDDSVFIDIGANIGLYSLDFKLRLPQLEVHAFEPEQITYECLKKSVDGLKFQKFHLNNLGLGEKEQELVFYKDIKNSGGHSFLPGSTRRARSEVKIRVSTLDHYVEKQNLKKVDVIKIDVEGFEIFVLKGALKTIAKYRPIILFEQIYIDDENENVVSILSNNLNDNFTLSCLRTMEEITPQEFKDYCQRMALKGIKGDDYLIKFL